MKISPRYAFEEQDKPLRVTGLVLVVETEKESQLLDSLFGETVGDDGLIGTLQAECRLADGCREHYVIIKRPHG